MAVLIFDFDGTLHDSMRIYAPAVRFCHRKLVEGGLLPDRVVPEEEIRGYLGLTAAQMWQQFAPNLTEEQHQTGSRTIYQEMARLTKAGVARLYDGAQDVLKELKESGHRLVFLSNCSVNYMDLHTRTFGLDQYFDEIYCAEQFDWAEKPQIVRQLIPGWDVRLIIAIGDRFKDMEIVRAASEPGEIPLQNGSKPEIKTVFCTYGFGSPEEGKNADAIAASILDIPACIRKCMQT